eukprot:54869_1
MNSNSNHDSLYQNRDLNAFNNPAIRSLTQFCDHTRTRDPRINRRITNNDEDDNKEENTDSGYVSFAAAQDKPFKCNQCRKTFKYHSQVVAHVRIHTGDKPFECNTCGKKFSQKGTLKIHMRSHTGAKPYSCHICQKTFTQRG